MKNLLVGFFLVYNLFSAGCELVNRVVKNLALTVYGTFALLMAPEEKRHATD